MLCQNEDHMYFYPPNLNNDLFCFHLSIYMFSLFIRLFIHHKVCVSRYSYMQLSLFMPVSAGRAGVGGNKIIQRRVGTDVSAARSTHSLAPVLNRSRFCAAGWISVIFKVYNRSRACYWWEGTRYQVHRTGGCRSYCRYQISGRESLAHDSSVMGSCVAKFGRGGNVRCEADRKCKERYGGKFRLKCIVAVMART